MLELPKFYIFLNYSQPCKNTQGLPRGHQYWGLVHLWEGTYCFQVEGSKSSWWGWGWVGRWVVFRKAPKFQCSCETCFSYQRWYGWSVSSRRNNCRNNPFEWRLIILIHLAGFYTSAILNIIARKILPKKSWNNFFSSQNNLTWKSHFENKNDTQN